MRPESVRWLTRGERALVREVFGGAVEPGRVRVVALPIGWPPRPFVPGAAFGRAWIVYPATRARADFSVGPLAMQALFVHEMVHVWQAQQGRFLPWAKLQAGDSAASYAYTLDGRAFAAMNIEQQAMAVEHAFRLSRGGVAPYPAEAYAALLPFGR